MVVKRKIFPKNVMFSVAVSKLERTSVFLVEPGVKINGQDYRNELLTRMLLEMNNLSRDDHIFLEDGAGSHTENETIKYLNDNCPLYAKSDHWPPNSPILNMGRFSKEKFEKQTA